MSIKNIIRKNTIKGIIPKIIFFILSVLENISYLLYDFFRKKGDKFYRKHKDNDLWNFIMNDIYEKVKNAK